VDAECAHDVFRVTGQSLAGHLTRFRFYCRGARYASKGLVDGIVTAGVVGARACLLAYRHGSLKFLGVAAAALLERESG
jgi:hypothetical protein